MSQKRKLVVSTWMTLDGVFDADSMEQWFAPYDSEERQKYIQESILTCDAIVFGRTTYEMLAPYWSACKNNEDGVADKLNSVTKYVVSSTLKEADWNNTTIIGSRVAEEVTKLKEQPGREIQIEGSATLAQSLTDADLIDEYRFLVHPVVMGAGKRFFKDGKTPTKLKLVSSETLDLGVHLLVYQPARS
jgi:dihydrofolate reductase